MRDAAIEAERVSVMAVVVVISAASHRFALNQNHRLVSRLSVFWFIHQLKEPPAFEAVIAFYRLYYCC